MMNEPEMSQCPMCGIIGDRSCIVQHQCGARGVKVARPEQKPEPDRERIEFIRRAAIAMAQCPSTFTGPLGGVYCAGQKRAWELAKALWDARPDDC